jgi:hypothetical protein
VARPGSCIHELAKGHRRGEVGFGRFLRNPSVTVAALSEAEGNRTGERVAGRDILAIQDTSEIVLGGPKLRKAGFGPVGHGGFLGGVLLHPVLAVDAMSGELIGLADIAVWNRSKRSDLHHARRPLDQKESRKWLHGARRVSEVLAKASRITVVSDRESDLYENFALKPENVHVLIRASSNRNLGNGQKLFDYAASLPEAGRISVTIPASPGRPARQAHLVLRFGPVRIKRPQRGMPSPDLKRLPETVELHLVDICEVDAARGVEPIHWRLLTSHEIEDFGAAHLMLDFYRKRWIIEEYFRTLKSAGFKIEDARMSDPKAFMNFTALAAIAAVTVTQMLRARDNPSGQTLADAFDPDDRRLLLAICKDYEGEAPTTRRKNPHPPNTLAFATWVIARLGAWTGYYGKPGPATLARGLRRYYEMKYGARISAGIV